MTQLTTIFVGLSGGVDSSVSALLLKKQGFDVQGLFMKNWEEEDTLNYCPQEQDLKDVKQVCQKLNIPLHTVNFSEEYWKNVFSFFLEEYRAGRTPNPDILCNKEIKFHAFLHYAKKYGADFIATGHYVQKNEGLKFTLHKAIDDQKDQSYFLYTLNQEALSQSLFPIGHLEKSQVRRIALEAGFINHNKKDSTGICFIGERKFKSFLQDFLLSKEGKIQTPEGINLGEHEGIMYYTLGQRKGLNIGGKKGMLEKPWYVVGKEMKNNILFVTQNNQHPWHFSTQLIANKIHWIQGESPQMPLRCFAKIRYRQADQSCIVYLIENEIWVAFDSPQRAVTPGQSIVFYQDNLCLGGGVIQETNSPGGLIKEKIMSTLCHQFHGAKYADTFFS